ncbi:hypothetical protein VIGAN_01034500 [Vigna angularis var. angularis]|uniref:Uncharacterized protein n=1 Tax=Vigna angularis var. angularis TaxID=157739 RepID=A0A0S3QX28_PHAAN|nr:hypothetical protein VIGAN_01034500 [Vigna angularis var. angularis]
MSQVLAAAVVYHYPMKFQSFQTQHPLRNRKTRLNGLAMMTILKVKMKHFCLILCTKISCLVMGLFLKKKAAKLRHHLANQRFSPNSSTISERKRILISYIIWY